MYQGTDISKGKFEGSYIRRLKKGRYTLFETHDILISEGKISLPVQLETKKPDTSDKNNSNIEEITLIKPTVSLPIHLLYPDGSENCFYLNFQDIGIYNCCIKITSKTKQEEQGHISGDINAYTFDKQVLHTEVKLENPNSFDIPNSKNQGQTTKTKNKKSQFLPGILKKIIQISLLLSGLIAFYYFFVLPEADHFIAEESKETLNTADKQKKDSFRNYLNAIRELIANHSLKEALSQTEKAEDIADQSDLPLVASEKKIIYEHLVKDYLKSKDYQNAISALTYLTENYPDESSFFYKRAVCHVKLKNIKTAVKDLKRAILLGNPEAIKLHNKINPIRKRVAYYITRCCDGSISAAKGSGACSHHGGVCDWKEPVYEEYRKYD